MDSELPSLKELGDDLLRVRPFRIGISILAPFATAGLYFWFAFHGFWIPALFSIVYLSFCTYASVSHDLVHRTLGLSRLPNDLLLSTIEVLCLRSGSAYRKTHLYHHRVFPQKDDIEASIAYDSLSRMLLLSPFHQLRLWIWSYRTATRRGKATLLLEASLVGSYVVFSLAMLQRTPVFFAYAVLVTGGSWFYPLATVYLPHDPKGTNKVTQTRMFRSRCLDVLSLGHLYHLEHHLYPAIPHHNWRELARRLDPYLSRMEVKPAAFRWPERFRHPAKPPKKPMISLPTINDSLFPTNSRGAIARFWFWYWGYFFLVLPWMLLRQAFLSARETCGAIWNWNRQITLLDGSLRIISMSSLPSLAITALFGERFTAIHYEDLLIDPGPVFGRRRLSRYLQHAGKPIHAVFATHGHEEHVGNVALCSEMTGAAIYGSEVTLNTIRTPETLSWMRSAFIGQPLPAKQADLRCVEDSLATPCVHLTVIQSPGHCTGHASLFDAARGILFAGDSFLHTIFTSPNKDVSGKEWIATLERYQDLDIRTMVGTHGQVYSVDPKLTWQPFVVERTAPHEMIRDKLAFLRWARDVVAEGERRLLPYGVIEACLFPWQRTWSWQNWFTDESGRLFSGGEFSRTHFIRSLSQTPDLVPPRFPVFVRCLRWIRHLLPG